MAKKNEKKMSNDEIRQAILDYFYESRTKARGLSSLRLGQNKIYSAMKKKGISRSDAIVNLSYLIENRWIKEHIEHYRVPGKNFNSQKRTYSLSPTGLDMFDESSKFQLKNNLAGINISSIRNSVIVVGNNNIVRTEFKHVYDSLDKLGNRIRLSDKLTDQEKIDNLAEIDTIQSQLKKEKPDKSIIKKAWEGIKNNLVTVTGLAALVEQVGLHIVNLI